MGLILSSGTCDPADISLSLLLELCFMTLFPKHGFIFQKCVHGDAT